LNLLVWIPKNFQKLLALGLITGFLWPNLIAPLAAWNDLMVAGIIFNGFLTRQAETDAKNDIPRLAINIAGVKILFPIMIYFTTRSLDPDISLPLVLLASIPAAGVSPSLIRLLGGDGGLATKILLSESIVSCVSVPLLFSFFYGAEHAISSLALARYFSLVLLIPLILAWAIRKITGPKNIAALAPWGSAVSVILIVTLVSAIAGKISPALIAEPHKSLVLVTVACLAVPLFGLVSLVVNRPRSKGEAITFMIKNNYINIGLGLGIAASYFSPGVAMALLAYVIPVNLLPRAMSKLAVFVSSHRIKKHAL
jgi:predicted Na+-dependent transporter